MSNSNGWEYAARIGLVIAGIVAGMFLNQFVPIVRGQAVSENSIQSIDKQISDLNLSIERERRDSETRLKDGIAELKSLVEQEQARTEARIDRMESRIMDVLRDHSQSPAHTRALELLLEHSKRLSDIEDGG